MSSFKENFRNFLFYVWGTLIHPRAAFDRLLAEPNPLVYGGLAILLVGILYTIAQFVGYLNGFGPCWKPFLPIAEKEYYFYQTFFTIPVFWLTTLVFASVVQFFSGFFGGKGKFEDCVAVFGFSLHITMIPLMLIPETIMFIFNFHLPGDELCGTTGLGPVADTVRMGAAALWPVIVTFIGLKEVHQYSWLKTILIGLIGLVSYEIVFWTYIR